MRRFKGILILTLALGFILSAGVSFGQIWHTPDQSTLAWDAVTEMGGGTPIPSGDKVVYNVFLKTLSDSTPVPIAQGIEATQYTITFPGEGSYFAGVSAVRQIGSDPNDPGNSESTIAWTDDPNSVLNGETFGWKNYFVPLAPSKLRKP